MATESIIYGAWNHLVFKKDFIFEIYLSTKLKLFIKTLFLFQSLENLLSQQYLMTVDPEAKGISFV